MWQRTSPQPAFCDDHAFRKSLPLRHIRRFFTLFYSVLRRKSNSLLAGKGPPIGTLGFEFANGNSGPQAAVSMKMGKHIIVVGLLLAVAALAGWALHCAQRPKMMLYGYSADYWIRSLALPSGSHFADGDVYDSNEVAVLLRALEESTSRSRRIYEKAWPHLPAVLQKCLARPLDSQTLFMNASIALDTMKSVRHDGSPIREAVRVLVRAVGDDDFTIRHCALGCLGWVDGGDAEVLPLFTRALGDKDVFMRQIATMRLEKFPDQAKVVVPLLEHALRDSNALVRVFAAQSLDKLEPDAAARADVVKVLLECEQEGGMCRPFAISALGGVHQQPELVVPLLITLLQPDVKPVNLRASAAHALGMYGSSATAAIPLLQGMVHDPEWGLSLSAKTALKQIVPEDWVHLRP